MSGRLVAWAGALALGALALAGPGQAVAAAGPGLDPALSTGPASPVIVLLQAQHPELPAQGQTMARRAAAVDADQAPVLGELARVHARGVRRSHVVNAISATVTAAEARRLSTTQGVRAVVPDLPVAAPPPASDAPAGGVPAQASAAELQQLCPPNPAVPLLEPEALQRMRVEFQPGDPTPSAHQLADGTGVKVGFIADGLDINNPDLSRSGHTIFADYQDFSGDGTAAGQNGAEAFGDASSIAAQGSGVYDLSQFVNKNHPLPPGCNVRVEGVAPGASLVGLKVFGQTTISLTSNFIQAIDRAVTVDHVDVLNESFGANVYPDQGTDPVALADEAAVQAGVTVVVSSGDAGRTDTIGRPASAPDVITVGATTTYRRYRQTGADGSVLSPGGWVSDNISPFSSGGPTQLRPRVVDAVAPGDTGWSVCDTCGGPGRNGVQGFGGTSESAPLVAGTAALVIQAYRKTHGGASPSPALVKQVITGSAQDLGVVADEQGAGLVNARRAVELAMSVHDGNGRPTATGTGLLTNPTALEATAPAGTTAHFQVRVTNAGSQAQTLAPSVRELDPAPLSSDTGSLTLAQATAPTFDSGGSPQAYTLHQFAVPPGAQRLDGDIAWQAQRRPGSVVRLTLFDPFGRFAMYSVPQGSSGIGQVDVRNPDAGTWTAVVWTSKSAAGYDGPVQFAFTTQRFRQVGRVSPKTVTLAPGRSATLTVDVPLPTTPGDAAASLVLDGGSVPITLRGLVPLGHGGGRLSGVLTGGNGRPITGGQTLQYQFDVPRHAPALAISLQLHDPDYNVTALLADPQGEPLDLATTGQPGAAGTTLTNALQLFQRSPRPGRWSLVLVLSNPIDGAHLQEPFSGRIDLAPPQVTASGLPTSGHTVLARGKPATVQVHVTNNGVSRKDFFVDPRLAATGTTALAGLRATSVQMPVQAGAPLPSFLVPPDTTQLIVAAASTVPLQLATRPLLGEPNVFGSSLGTVAVAVHGAPEVAPALWQAFPGQIGPAGTGPVAPATAQVTAAATTRLFDPAVTSSTGDAWLAAIGGTAPYTPLTLDPGQSGTITVTITPDAAPGTVVRGSIDVDTFSPLLSGGDQVTALPYTYKVGGP